jgi:hypothetical protein
MMAFGLQQPLTWSPIMGLNATRSDGLCQSAGAAFSSFSRVKFP